MYSIKISCAILGGIGLLGSQAALAAGADSLQRNQRALAVGGYQVPALAACAKTTTPPGAIRAQCAVNDASDLQSSNGLAASLPVDIAAAAALGGLGYGLSRGDGHNDDNGDDNGGQPVSP